MALAEDVQAFLIAQSVGTDPSNRQAWPIYIGYMPDDDTSVDRLICVYEMPGRAPEGNWDLGYPRVIVRVRSNPDYDYPVARAKAQSIYNVMHNTFADIKAGYVSCTSMDSVPLNLGADSKRRFHFSIMFEIIKPSS